MTEYSDEKIFYKGASIVGYSLKIRTKSNSYLNPVIFNFLRQVEFYFRMRRLEWYKLIDCFIFLKNVNIQRWKQQVIVIDYIGWFAARRF